MKIKKYLAGSVREALLLVKEDLGPEAIILKTEEKKGLVKANERVEVTAALDESSLPEPAMPQSTPVQNSAVSNTSGTYSRQGVRPVEWPQADETTTIRAADLAGGQGNSQGISVSENSEQSASVQQSKQEENSAKVEEALQESRDEMQALRREMKSLRDELLRGQKQQSEDALPQGLEDLYEYLLERELEHEEARDILAEVLLRLPIDERTHENLHATAAQVVGERIPVRGKAQLRTNRASILLFMGPTGVGKSTTIAKIAGDLVMREKRKVGILTTDSYRMGAVEQMSAFARVAEVQLETLFEIDDVDDCLDRLADRDLILVDTAGRSRNNEEHLGELQELIARIHPDEIHLVCPANMRERDLMRTIELFRPMGVNRLLFTKLDECDRFSTLYRLPRRSGVGISYLCHGQGIPDDLQSAEAAQVAHWVLEAEG
jgi:flagellar biosynthesis protein FlhF